MLPAVSVVSSLINVLELFFLGEFYLGCVGVTLFLLPTLLVLSFYLENMFHRPGRLLETALILVFGPFLRLLASLRLITMKLNPETGQTADQRDLERFTTATKVIDGVFQTAVQVVTVVEVDRCTVQR